MRFHLLLFAVVFCAVIVQNDAQRPTLTSFFQNLFTPFQNIFRRRPSSSSSSSFASSSSSNVGGQISESDILNQIQQQQAATFVPQPVVAEPVYVTVTATADPVYITEVVTAEPTIERLTSVETMFDYVTSTITETVYATEKVYDTVMQTAYVTSTVMQEPAVAEALVAENAVPSEPFEAIVVQATPTARMLPYAVKRSVEIEASEK